ncbi:MAG TPA: hypothetical protein DDW76_31860 [Cyanobacteria bacterium UBA11369]|nr:hypothetical protein [Cyanobacteria bacterium UBA11371]HBE53239.1 hypothetical protein [Cyanobacteria bacterium UBA11369]
MFRIPMHPKNFTSLKLEKLLILFWFVETGIGYIFTFLKKSVIINIFAVKNMDLSARYAHP